MFAFEQEKLFEDIEFLPIDIKIKLIEKLLNSITPKNKDIDKLWIDEANKRKQEIENNKILLIDGDKVFEDIANRLKWNTLFIPKHKKRDYYEECQKGLGLDFANEVYKIIQRVINFPNAWKKVDEKLRRYLIIAFPLV